MHVHVCYMYVHYVHVHVRYVMNMHYIIFLQYYTYTVCTVSTVYDCIKFTYMYMYMYMYYDGATF